SAAAKRAASRRAGATAQRALPASIAISPLGSSKKTNLLPAAGSCSSTMSAHLGRVLGVQSHVVQGHVGADAFTFPLQALGLDVGCIYTCQFVDLFVHEGSQLERQQLSTILKHLNASSFLPPAANSGEDTERAYEPPFRYIVSGFVGKADLLDVTADWLSLLRAALGPRKAPLYVCDPVMGDCGKLYVHPGCIDSYMRKLLPLADVITPNQYEAGWLLGSLQQQKQQQQQDPQQQKEAGWRECSCPSLPIENWGALVTAIDALHAAGPEVVIITSVEFSAPAAAQALNILAAAEKQIQQPNQQQGEHLFVVASRQQRPEQRCAPPEGSSTAAEGLKDDETPKERREVLYALAIPKAKGYIGGAGDLFTALFTGFFVKEQFHLGRALQKTVAAVQAVIADTTSRSPRPQTVDAVTAQAFLLNPPACCIRKPILLPRIQKQQEMQEQFVETPLHEALPAPPAAAGGADVGAATFGRATQQQHPGIKVIQQAPQEVSVEEERETAVSVLSDDADVGPLFTDATPHGAQWKRRSWILGPCCSACARVTPPRCSRCTATCSPAPAYPYPWLAGFL
ncbi:uncharacterized protein LOC113147618, partial [Cyclospora cayetanensis]|uniref:pyridoxal kinase n=1 Tax=Cyclospora cayetanensis TaxID=88456 RepID=A0A6P6S478_9EIME